MASVKKELPSFQIAWVVCDTFASTVRDCGFVDQVFEFRRGAGLFAYVKLIREIRRHHFSSVFEMQGLLRSAVLCAAAKATAKWGRHDGREGSIFFYAKVPPLNDAHCVHAVDVLLSFKDVIGLEPKLTGELRFPGAFLSKENEEILNVVTKGGVRPLVTLFPESRRLEKQWSQFLQLAKQLKKLDKFGIAWAGLKPEDSSSLVGMANFAGKTSLREIPALIERSAVVVTNDSAPLHFASALGRPLVGLFGPTDPRRFGPYPIDSSNVYVIRAPNEDLGFLDVESVKKKILDLLGGL